MKLSATITALILVLNGFIRTASAHTSDISANNAFSWPTADVSDETAAFQSYLDLGLPLLVITTDSGKEPTYEIATGPAGTIANRSITNAEKLPGTIKRIEPDGTVSYNSGSYEKGVSGCTLKIRGNGSAFRPKKPFKIKLQKKGDLLVRGDENYYDKNWVLINDIMIHNSFGFFVSTLFNKTWSPACEHVNVIINNDFRGMYLLAEAIERNEKCRIPTSKEGFVIENDCYWWNENGEYIPSVDHPKMGYTFKYPDFADLTDQQKAYITNRIETLESSIISGDFEKYLDLESYASWVLCHDLLGTKDALGANRYLLLRNGNNSTKFEMGPVWDLDSSEELPDGYSHFHYSTHLVFSKLFTGNNKSLEKKYISIWKERGNEIYGRIVAELNAMLAEGNDAFDKSADATNAVWHSRGATDIVKWAPNINRKLEYFKNRKDWLDLNLLGYLNDINEEFADDDESDAAVYNINGVYMGSFGDLENCSTLEKGIYIVKSRTKTRKIII